MNATARTDPQPDDPGAGVTFLTPLQTIRYPEMAANDGGTFGILLAEYRVAIDGRVITVPAGFATDLASIPRRLRGFVSVDRGVEAAVVHDWLYANGIGSRKEADLIFKRLLLASESRATAQIMYLAVRLGGKSSWQGT